MRRSVSTGAYKDGILYYSDFSGFLHALDAKTGKPFWVHDMLAAVWGSPIVVDDKVYLGDEDGDVVVLQHGKEKKLLAEQNMGSSVYCSIVPANGALIIANRNQLYSIGAGAAAPAKPKVAAATAKYMTGFDFQLKSRIVFGSGCFGRIGSWRGN
ncbi:MAG: PQQ-binding-like beta-propeller repeat protein [Bryobacteraceae bacterium]